MNKISAILATQEPKPSHCDEHGDFESRNLFRDVWSKCPQCAANQQATEQREAEERDAAAKHFAWQRKLGEAAIPERFRSRTLESYTPAGDGQRSALAFSQEYACNFSTAIETGRSAIFCGKPGTGKTHLAVGIGLEVMRSGRLVLFTTAQRAFRRMKDAWRSDSNESEGDVIRLLVQPDLLILDEIGVQFGTKFEENALFDILNERYEKRRPSLLLSNLTAPEVRTFLGERVYDRIKEDGGVIVPFDWASHRGKE
jgi:DNA replication protein DnaC